VLAPGGPVEGFKGDEAMGTSRTTEVTVIGLGNTGRQLARVLLEKGKTVTDVEPAPPTVG